MVKSRISVPKNVACMDLSYKQSRCTIDLPQFNVCVCVLQEFFTFFQYLGYIIIFFLNLVSFIHINQVGPHLSLYQRPASWLCPLTSILAPGSVP